MHGIWGRFEQALGEEYADVGETLAWALLAERLLDAVVIAIRGPGYPTRDAIRTAHRSWWLNQEGQAILSNQDGVMAFLHRLKLNTHRRAAARCLRAMLEDEVRHETLLSRLPLQLLLDRLIAAWPETQHISSYGALARDEHPVDHVSFDRAEALIGCQEGLLYFLIRKGFFQSVTSLQRGRKRYTFIRTATSQSHIVQLCHFDGRRASLRLAAAAWLNGRS